MIKKILIIIITIFLLFNIEISTYAKDNNFIKISQETCEHEYDINIIKEATCEEMGLMISTCKICGKTVTDEISSLGHNVERPKKIREATKSQNGLEITKCERCEKIIEKYEYTRGDVIKENILLVFYIIMPGIFLIYFFMILLQP